MRSLPISIVKGGNGVNKVNSFSAQYIFYYNLPKAWYVQSNATIIAIWQPKKEEVKQKPPCLIEIA